MGMITRAIAKLSAPTVISNAKILKGNGIDLDTVLTPKNRRKKPAGLRGGDPEEQIPTVLGG